MGYELRKRAERLFFCFMAVAGWGGVWVLVILAQRRRGAEDGRQRTEEGRQVPGQGEQSFGGRKQEIKCPKDGLFRYLSHGEKIYMSITDGDSGFHYGISHNFLDV